MCLSDMLRIYCLPTKLLITGRNLHRSLLRELGSFHASSRQLPQAGQAPLPRCAAATMLFPFLPYFDAYLNYRWTPQSWLHYWLPLIC